MPVAFLNFTYLVASVLFIVGLKGLTHPRTAVRGNLLSALGMLIAVLVTVADRQIIAYELILAGVVIGSGLGALLALKIHMTAMPQMVALLNGFGGGASLLVAGAALIEATAAGGVPDAQFTISAAASGVVGAVTFWGSLVAFAKLQELISGNPVILKGRHALNGALALLCVLLAAWLVAEPDEPLAYWSMAAAASLLGVL
ncbi:MAG: NAD(P)(+) transhydrogenase (Re/Si-specific) subunit beta, partial [Bryobacteraceae bacterium]